MRVSTKALFNLISKTDTKETKEILQKIVSTKEELPASVGVTKKTNVKELINQLLKELSGNTKTKENILQEIKQSDIPKLMKNTTSELKSLLSLIKSDKTLSKFAPILEKLLLHVEEIKPETLKQSLAKSGTLMESKLSSEKTQTIPVSLKEVLTNLKEVLTKELPKQELKALHVKTIDRILDTPKADKNFLNDIKTLILNLKQTDSANKPVVKVLAKVEEIVQKSSLVASKVQNASSNAPLISPKEIAKVVDEVKKVLGELKALVLDSDKKSILEPKSQEIVKLVEQTLKTPEFFPKELNKATISEKLQQVVNLIKSELIKTDAKSPLHVKIENLTNRLENAIKENIATKQIVPNQKLQVEIPIKQELANDIKATLLNIKHELSTQTTPMAREISLHVDRVITQIEYFQLLSITTNSQATYLPFLWDGLDEGQVSLKKLKENRFFCEINLKLKEYGKIDLMLMLFDDIHLNISVYAEKKEFIDLVQENLLKLKQGINKVGLIPSNIQLKEGSFKDKTNNKTNFLGTGLNIEA